MEKKSNDGKTFGDIFSKVNDNEIKFDNLKEKISEVDDTNKEEKTFNSIFDKVVEESKEEKKSFSNMFDKVDSDEAEIEKVVDNNQLKIENEIEKEKESFSNMFDKVENEKENVEKDNKINKENTSFSSVFDKVDSDEAEKEVDNNQLRIENEVEEEKESFSNMFDKVENVLEKENKSKENLIFDEVVKDDNKEENVIDNNVDANIFFSDNGKEEKVVTEDKDVAVDKNDINPFFDDVEENKNEENPFFNNKINLVEKPDYDNKDVNGKIDLTNVQNFDVKIRKKRPNLFQAILGILSYALFIWLLLIGIALLVYVLDIKIRSVKGDDSPPKYGAYVVLTGSMLPEIQVYDVVVTKQQDAKDLKEGDIITFSSADTRFAGTIITHRIIKKNYNSKTKSYTFQTKGDNNNVADSALVSPNDILGKVIFKIPKLGYLRDFLASDGGWIIVVLFPCLAVVAYDIVKIGKGLKRKKYKNIIVQSR